MKLQSKEVTLQTHGKDKYGRTLADVLLLDGPLSTTHSSKTAGAGGIESMRQVIPCSKGWRRKHEKPRKACGLILLLSHHGSIAKRGGGYYSTSQM